MITAEEIVDEFMHLSKSYTELPEAAGFEDEKIDCIQYGKMNFEKAEAIQKLIDENKRLRRKVEHIRKVCDE